MKLSIIIVNYNCGRLLIPLLKQLFQVKDIDLELFVVDNNSTDGSVEAIAKDFPSVKLLANKENIGFAKANNQVLRLANGEYILFLNPDTEVPPETLSKVLRFIEGRGDIAALTCRVELKDGSLDKACHRGFPTPWASISYFLGLEKIFPKSKIFARYHMGWEDLTKPHEIDSPSGCFFLARKKVLDEVGGFDEDYFLYGEDVDLSFRIREKGYKIFFYPEAKIIHYKGVSSGVKISSMGISAATKKTRDLAIRSFYSANRLFFKKHLAKRYPFFVNWLVSLGSWLLEKKSKIFQRI